MAGETRYELLETVGTGRFTTVYRARDRELNREVAVKQLRDEFLSGTLQMDRYWQEAQLLASLQHPNIVTIYDIDRQKGWLVMELMQGTLSGRFAGRQMDLRALKTALAHSLRALHYLHDLGIVHGDIKPSNIMIDARRRIKLGDFGLARRVSDRDGTLLKGDTRYIAPEVVSDDFGDVESSSDLYSLGFVAYELMCGPPFEELALGLGALRSDTAGEDPWIEWHAAPDRRLPRISEVLEGVPEDLAAVIQRLTEKDKARRYTSAEEALSDLNIDLKLVRRDDTPGTGETDVTEAAPANRRRTIAIAAACASVFVSLLMIFWSPGGNSTTPGDADTVSDVVVLEKIFDDGRRLQVRNMTTGVESDLRLDDDVGVMIRRNPETTEHATLKDLAPGDRLELKRTAGDSPRVVELTAAHAVTHNGLVSELDVPASQLVVSPQAGGDRDEILVRVANGTRLRFNGRKGELVDVQPGDRVTAIHVRDAGDSGSRLAIRVEILRTRRTVGMVHSVDAAEKRLALRLQHGASSPGRRAWTLADTAKLSGRGARAAKRADWSLESIKPEMFVIVEHDQAISAVTIFETARSLIRGSIDSIDAASGRLTVQAAEGNVNLKVDEQADVFLNGRPTGLEDLRPEDTAWVSAEPDGGRTLVVAAERAARSHRWALLIGTSRYWDRSLTPLPFAGNDLKLVADHLGWFYRVPADGTHSQVLNDTHRADLKKQVSDFLGRLRGEAELIVYTTGHVYRGDDDRLWLAPRGFDWENMAETGVALGLLADRIESCRGAEKVWLLDVTHDGSGRDLQRQPDGAALLATLGKRLKTTTLITSCGAGQTGLVDSRKRHGLFAWHVANGFRGSADTDRDGHISGVELFDHLRNGLRRDGERLGRTQTPEFSAPR